MRCAGNNANITLAIPQFSFYSAELRMSSVSKDNYEIRSKLGEGFWFSSECEVQWLRRGVRGSGFHLQGPGGDQEGEACCGFGANRERDEDVEELRVALHRAIQRRASEGGRVVGMLLLNRMTIR